MILICGQRGEEAGVDGDVGMEGKSVCVFVCWGWGSFASSSLLIEVMC